MAVSQHFDEIIVFFFIHKTDSFKNTAKQKKCQEDDPRPYQLRVDSNMTHITMKTFHFHDFTKAVFTDYLTDKIRVFSKTSSKLVIASASDRTRSNKMLAALMKTIKRPIL